MIDQLFMKDLAFDLAPPLEPVEQPATLLAAGPATSDVGQVTVQGYNEAKPSGVRVGRAGITPEQSAKAGGLDRPLVALLDTLAGALKGATAQTLGLPGDIRSIMDLISKEGAQKYLGDAVLPTTEQMQDILPAVVPQGVANQADREYTAKMASEIGTFLPAPGIPEAAVQGAKMVGKVIKATKGLPVGMSTQAVGEGVDNLGFYSAAKQAVDAIQQPKGTGDQFLKQIEKTPGVKPDEIKWTGLDEFLKSKKSVTKAEVQEYLDKNRVEVKEVQLGENKGVDVAKGLNAKLSDKGYTVSYDAPNDKYTYTSSDGIKSGYAGLPKEIQNIVNEVDFTTQPTNATKFSKYTLPGGENYREVLLTLPGNKARADNLDDAFKLWMADAKAGKRGQYTTDELASITVDDVQDILKEEYLTASKKGEFRSQHFEQPNILAHLRVNDRVDVDGKKVLFVEEVQSDWHQAGRKKGYVQPDLKPEDVRAEFIPPNVPEGANPDNYPGYYEVFNNKTGELVTRAGGGLSPERAIQEAIGIANATKSGVPDAPFKTTWSELSMKRAIQMASEGGYDRIAFTTGKTQAERFDLSKQINDVTAEKLTSGTMQGKYSVTATDKEGKLAINEVVAEDKLEDLFGKDLAKKIIDDSSDYPDGKQYRGVDLQVGGEGMKGFYDDILPKFLNKYAKKWDAKAGMTEIPTEPTRGEGGMPSMYPEKVPVHYIDITPKMRESVVTKGQPMFAIGAGGAGAAATQQEDNK